MTVTSSNDVKAAKAVFNLVRFYSALDGCGSIWEIALRFPRNVVLDDLYAEFQQRAEAAGGADNLPRLQGSGNLAIAFCYNHDWLAFMRWLIEEKEAQAQAISHTETGDRDVFSMARNDAITDEDVERKATIRERVQQGHYDRVLYDSPTRFEPVTPVAA